MTYVLNKNDSINIVDIFQYNNIPPVSSKEDNITVIFW